MSVGGVARRNSLPVIHVTGSHYDIGYDIGRTFASFIKEYVDKSSVLNNDYIPAYKKVEGKKIYDETLAAVANRYPQYLRELEGTADGAGIPFYKLFLMHLDDIILSSECSTNIGQGCSTITVNYKNKKIIGHTEDGLKETMNLVYIVKARITESSPHEVFTAFCYPGILPGYAMGFNDYFAYSMNVVALKKTVAGQIPRTFLTRALLRANSFHTIEEILRCPGGGIADALSLNVMMLEKDSDDCQLYNVEVGPNFPPTDCSLVNVKEINDGDHLFHCNKIKVASEIEVFVTSSNSRHETQKNLPEPTNLTNIINLLGDSSVEEPKINIFRNRENERVSTLAIGIFNGVTKTWSVYMGNPKHSEPVLVLPMTKSPS